MTLKIIECVGFFKLCISLRTVSLNAFCHGTQIYKPARGRDALLSRAGGPEPVHGASVLPILTSGLQEHGLKIMDLMRCVQVPKCGNWDPFLV